MKDFESPWPNSRRTPIIANIERLIQENTTAYKKVREEVKWESPRLDRFVGEAFRLGNLLLAMRTYNSETIETMKRGFVELDD